MRALALDGRAAEALDVARLFRRRLDDEVGLEPTAALDDLEQQIAGGELAATVVSSPPHTMPRPRGRCSSPIRRLRACARRRSRPGMGG